jgi:exopolysaccharide production protein ExoQ
VANRIALTLVFVLSFLTYLAPELTASVQLAPLLLFATLVVVRVLFSISNLRAVGSLLELDGLVFVVFLSLLMMGPSMASSYDKSTAYALLISACLILARLYMAVVPIREVLEAFFWSGIVSVALFVPLSFAALMQSVQTLDRFGYVNLQTNILAFLLTGYLCVAVWKFFTGGWCMKILTGAIGVCCAVMIFFTSSRGALIGGFIGCCFGAGMAFLRADKDRRLWLARRTALVASVFVIALLFFQSLPSVKAAYDYLDQALAITSPDRGVDSGFTGRFDNWKRTMGPLSGGNWLLGRGMRSSDSIYPMIDNSYLVILYDLGLFPLILITWRFLSILRRFLNAYFRALDESQRKLYLVCCVLMVMLLAINIVERFLFGVGNPYSLLALLFFATPTSVIGQELETSKADSRRSDHLAGRTFSNLQPSC